MIGIFKIVYFYDKQEYHLYINTCLFYIYSYGYAQLKSEIMNTNNKGDGLDDNSETTNAAKQQQSCLNCIGKIDRKVKILPSSVNSDAHARVSLKVTEKYLSGATRRQ